jgi:hypothetical protein
VKDTLADASRSRRLGAALVLGVAFASLLAFSLPALMYAGNLAEFGTPFLGLVAPAWLPALAAAVVFALLAAGLPARMHTRLVVLAAALCLLCWLQGTVLVWEYGVFDGRGIDWTQGRWRGWLDAGLWIAVLLAADAWRERLPRLLPRLAVVACAMQAAIACLSLSGDPGKPPRAGFDATVVEFSHFSQRANVLHILADGMQGDVAAELLAENGGRLGRGMDGFTLFADNVGAFPYTHMSVPAMLSGDVYDNSEKQAPFMARAMGPDSILATARAAGYNVEVGEPGGGLAEIYRYATAARVIELPSSPSAEGWRGSPQERLLLGDLLLFRVMPHFLKQYVYNDGEWLLQGLFGHTVVPGRRFLAHVAFLHSLAAQARVDSPRPTYKFLHLMLSHRPMVMAADCRYTARILVPDRENVRNQARCGFDAIAGVLARLRQLGIYDQTTVVISGDHGTFLAPAQFAPGSVAASRAFALGLPPRLLGHGRPLLLVKPAHAQGAMRISQAPAWLPDTPATIADAAALPGRAPGVSALRLRVGDARVRRYMVYAYEGSDWTADYLAPLQEFLVRGPSLQVDSWSMGRRLPPGAAVQKR